MLRTGSQLSAPPPPPPSLVQRCPTDGMTGRCDHGANGIQCLCSKDVATMGKGFCDNAHGAWSAP